MQHKTFEKLQQNIYQVYKVLEVNLKYLQKSMSI